MSLNVKPSSGRVSTGREAGARALPVVALGTALVLVTYVTPMATLPAAAADLGAGPAAQAWVLSSMSVGLAGALLATGVLGDALGRRRVYLAGLAAVGAGALVCAIAQEPLLLIGARVVQGVGGAAVLACGLALLAHTHAPGPARAHATSVWGASVGLGIATGALLAAALDLGSGWRETYVVTAALAALLLLPSVRALPVSTPAARRVDLPGLALLVLGMSCLVAALTEGRDGVDGPVVGLVVGGVLALAAMVVVERRVREPLVEPALLAHPRFRAATGGSLVLGLGMIGISSYVPTLAQAGLGESLWVGSLLVVAWAAASVVASLLVRLVRHPLEGGRPVALVLLVVAGGQMIGFGLDEGSAVTRVALAMVVSGLGTGVLNALLGREAVASVPPERAAMGSGANNTARYLGAACGITLTVTLAAHAGSGNTAPAALVAGWNVAVVVSASLTVLGAAAIAVLGRPRT
ncbi:MFS transporter [Nocardioides sp. Leaf307]|uniref:MFS transporter n=1 Tax=Nocardioides sp. Leaf307 TaxID=1736331 RepID=UPI0012E9AABF|nr:MFS transporter [Nocardioides sp. Leaf307]